MAAWTNPEEWAQLISGEACPICLHEIDTSRRGIAQLEVAYVTINQDAPLRGYCCLVLNRHAAELHHLRVDEAASFMSDLRRLSGALQQVTGAIKINVEIHGNTIPHLHAHLYPRRAGDPFEGKAIDWQQGVRADYKPGEFEQFVATLQAALRR